MIKFNIEKPTIDELRDIELLDNLYEFERYSFDTLKSLFENNLNTFYVAKISNEIVGYIVAQSIFDEGNIFKIVVKNSFRKLGLGRALITKILNDFKQKNVKKIFLEVRQNNDIAKSFYKSLGFRKESIRVGYYNGINCEIYWYYL